MRHVATKLCSSLYACYVNNSVSYESAGLTMYPKNSVEVDRKQAEQLLKMLDLLEDHDDVQMVYSNFDIDAAVIEELHS